jgi:hypothetical protein
MKTIYLLALSATVVMLFANCGKKDEPATGKAEMGANCYYVQTNQSTTANRTYCSYNYASVQGFTNYTSANGYAYASSFWGAATGCSAYQTTVYSEGKGLGCVDSNRLNMNGQPAMYNLDSSRGIFILTPATIYPQNTIYGGFSSGFAYNTGSSGNVLRACEGSGDPCPSGLTCRSPFGPYQGSAIGVCYY